MRKLLLISAIIPLILLSCEQKGERVEVQTILVNDQWKFSLGDDVAWADPAFDDSAWAVISVKSLWENQGYPDYDGYAWYRKQMVIPASYKENIERNGGLIISYDSADDVDELFFNGHSIGTTGSFPPEYEGKYDAKRKYIVPAQHLLYDQPNTIAVRVFDNGGGGGIATQEVLVRSMNELDGIKCLVDVPAKDWVFMTGEPQQLKLALNNTYDKKLKLNATFLLKTDKHKTLDSIILPVNLNPLEGESITIPFKLPEPGFYRCTVYLEKDGHSGDAHKFNIGYEPEKIISPRDAKEDFQAFWEETRKELNKVKPNYRVTLIPELSQGEKNIYKVEMMSFGNVKIEGRYAVPKARGIYPAIIVYMGYGSEGYNPSPDANPGYAEFILSVRGQGFLEPGNIYNSDWITYGLDSKENYYYRGAFMDLIRGIDFLDSRLEIDSKRIVAEGGSQGGAFTLAACALDDRLLAGAPTVPFLSDYRDYFEIVSWPESDLERFLAHNPGYTWDGVFDLLTYFDIKNLAEWITCPIIMGVGLQDEVCPPHTNFAGYNLIKSEKDYRIYFDQGHSTGEDWYRFRTEFFNKQIGR